MKPHPVDRETSFGIEELFFSTTDAKGIIRASNEVFVRVSGHPREALDGHAHNVVRHPDTPRAIFRLFWDSLRAGRPIAAYVKNMTDDGAYYWVMASAVPVQDGYLSVRLKPTGPGLAVAKRLYARLRAVEREVEGGDPRRRKPSIEAALAVLPELLAAEGYHSYDAFMHAALPAEVTAREALLGGGGVRERLGAPPADADPVLVRVLADCGRTHDFLDGLVANLEQYAALGHTLEDRSHFVLELADAIRLFALNALLAASRLGDDGVALGAVAGLMGVRSDSAGPIVQSLERDIAAAVDVLGDMGFRIAATKLQTEMLMRFADELLRGDSIDARVAAELGTLATSMADGTEQLLGSLATLDARLGDVLRHAGSLGTDLDQLRALQVNGRIEAARTAASGDVQRLFETIGEQVTAARAEMGGFDAVAAVADRRDGRAEAQVRGDLDAVRAHVLALAA
jgi:aerotaxis receptor